MRIPDQETGNTNKQSNRKNPESFVEREPRSEGSFDGPTLPMQVYPSGKICDLCEAILKIREEDQRLHD